MSDEINPKRPRGQPRIYFEPMVQVVVKVSRETSDFLSSLGRGKARFIRNAIDRAKDLEEQAGLKSKNEKEEDFINAIETLIALHRVSSLPPPLAKWSVQRKDISKYDKELAKEILGYAKNMLI